MNSLSDLVPAMNSPECTNMLLNVNETFLTENADIRKYMINAQNLLKTYQSSQSEILSASIYFYNYPQSQMVSMSSKSLLVKQKNLAQCNVGLRECINHCKPVFTRDSFTGKTCIFLPIISSFGNLIGVVKAKVIASELHN